jgi:hypothetical protein
MMSKTLRWVLALLVLVAVSHPALAHHILGRPAYSYNGDSSTPPSMSLEVQIGHFNVTAMAFPVELKVREPVRIKVYATRLDSDDRFNGEVTFSVRDDTLFPSTDEKVATQIMDDNGVYTQALEFKRDGNYIITAQFQADGEPYIVDFPVTVGKPMPTTFLVSAGAVVALGLFTVSAIKRRRRG